MACPGNIGAVGAGRRLAARGGRRDPRHLAAAYQACAARLLYCGAGGGLLQSRALRRRALRLRKTGKDISDLYEKTRAAGFGKEVRRRIMIGTYVLSAGYYDAYYLRAQKIRSLIKRDFDLAYAAGVDAILTPATPSPAFALGEKARPTRSKCISTTCSRSR